MSHLPLFPFPCSLDDDGDAAEYEAWWRAQAADHPRHAGYGTETVPPTGETSDDEPPEQIAEVRHPSSQTLTPTSAPPLAGASQPSSLPPPPPGGPSPGVMPPPGGPPLPGPPSLNVPASAAQPAASADDSGQPSEMPHIASAAQPAASSDAIAATGGVAQPVDAIPAQNVPVPPPWPFRFDCLQQCWPCQSDGWKSHWRASARLRSDVEQRCFSTRCVSE